MTTDLPFVINPVMADAMIKQWGAIPDNCVVMDKITLVQGEVGRFNGMVIRGPMQYTPIKWLLPDGRPPGFHRGASGTTPAPRIYRRSAVSRAARRALWGKP